MSSAAPAPQRLLIVSLLAVRDELIEATRSGAAAAEALMKRV